MPRAPLNKNIGTKDQKILPFNCEIESLKNKEFCLSHDATYLKDSNYSDNKDNVIKKLSEILYIGYYLPDIKIKSFLNSYTLIIVNFKMQTSPVLHSQPKHTS
jgi:hypothetical protein